MSVWKCRSSATIRKQRQWIRALDQLVSIYGGPEALHMDNGPELIPEALMAWCAERDITMHHIQPSKPDQNAYIERFNRRYREEVLDAYLFGSIEEAQAISDEWLEDYNTERPHDSLGQVPPRSFLPRKPIPGAKRRTTRIMVAIRRLRSQR